MTSRTKNVAPVANEEVITMSSVGLDIGFGMVKAVTLNNKLEPFPSVYGTARTIKFRREEIAAKYPGDQLYDDEGSWFCGNLALSQVPAGEQLYLRGRSAKESTIGNEFRLRLVKVALGKLFPGRKNSDAVHIRIATGLPVDHMPDAADLKSTLIGAHEIHTDSTKFIAHITDVMVMPQPYGTIYSQTLLKSGDVNPDHIYDRTGVVDVGTYSIDVTLDDKGEYIEAESGTAESGVYIAQQAIAAMFEERYRQKPSYGDVEQILRTGKLTIRGQKVNFKDEVYKALEPLRQATLKLIQQLWGTASRVDVIYLSGGGAYFVEAVIRAAYPQARIVIDAQDANAQGYFNYAMLTEKDSQD